MVYWGHGVAWILQASRPRFWVGSAMRAGAAGAAPSEEGRARVRGRAFLEGGEGEQTGSAASATKGRKGEGTKTSWTTEGGGGFSRKACYMPMGPIVP